MTLAHRWGATLRMRRTRALRESYQIGTIAPTPAAAAPSAAQSFSAAHRRVPLPAQYCRGVGPCSSGQQQPASSPTHIKVHLRVGQREVVQAGRGRLAHTKRGISYRAKLHKASHSHTPDKEAPRPPRRTHHAPSSSARTTVDDPAGATYIACPIMTSSVVSASRCSPYVSSLKRAMDE
jgi:hypothetical protein